MQVKALFLAGFLCLASVQAKSPVDPEIKAAAIRGAKFSVELSDYFLEALHQDPQQALIDKSQEALVTLPAESHPVLVSTCHAALEYSRALEGAELEEEIRYYSTQTQLYLEGYRAAQRMIRSNRYSLSQLKYFVIKDQWRAQVYFAASRIVHEAINDCVELVALLKNNLISAQEKLLTGRINLIAQHFTDLQPIPQEVINGVLIEDTGSIHELCNLIDSYTAPLGQILRQIEVENYLEVRKLKPILKLAPHYRIPLINNIDKTPALIKIENILKRSYDFTESGKEILITVIDNLIAFLESILDEIAVASDEEVSEVFRRLRPERIITILSNTFDEGIEASSYPIPILSVQKARLIKNVSMLLIADRVNLFKATKNILMLAQVGFTNKDSLDLILLPWNAFNPQNPVHIESILKL